MLSLSTRRMLLRTGVCARAASGAGQATPHVRVHRRGGTRYDMRKVREYLKEALCMHRATCVLMLLRWRGDRQTRELARRWPWLYLLDHTHAHSARTVLKLIPARQARRSLSSLMLAVQKLDRCGGPLRCRGPHPSGRCAIRENQTM